MKTTGLWFEGMLLVGLFLGGEQLLPGVLSSPGNQQSLHEVTRPGSQNVSFFCRLNMVIGEL